MQAKLIENLKPFMDHPWVISVSTGVDSMVLLDMALKMNHPVIVAHFNHQKRDASVIEAAYLKSYCEKKHIPFEYIVLHIEGNNFQDEAHHLRKMHLEKIAHKYNTPYILTAHHSNDLAETILMKLSRGSNLLGYSGFQMVSKRNEFIYLKPLLNFSKDMLYDYAKTHEVHFFEDASNLENHYTRNRYRNSIVPLLMDENPQFLAKINQFSNHLYEAFSYIRSQSKSYLVKHKNDIQITSFFSEDIVIQKDILACMMEYHSIDFNQLKIESILSFLKDSGPNQTYPLNEHYILKRVYQKASITKKSKTHAFHQELDLTAFNVLETMGFVTFLDRPSNSSFYEIKLCYNKLALPLVARSRLPGDTLEFPYGRKKLKDYYIDHKIPLEVRNRDILIVDQTGRILSILGRYYNASTDLDSTIVLRYKRGY
ncbi:tRNA lysidine(34) synthetase TilS [Acholeplasma vituli]|uniref:tRNA(Ile)-lysidine synthase n=1 Tax=Paracholeplasma vituli TaxID=69473 RepID=A0ABT2Q0W7_9MOLU|nr:tRNA lysidine(34) synthetase TilS [Paracholeplasma vituli]MCU0105592.1 tRNA lysidine(34) synthetase TilS [Paracholeplasma vituli]